MAEHQDSTERTEQPTQRRKQESRKKGQVPRSRELNTMMSLLFAAVAMLMLGTSIASGFATQLKAALTFGRQAAFDKAFVVDSFAQLGLHTLLLFTPFFAVLVVGAFVGPISMGGWSFSTEALAFKLEKIDPIKGLKRLFSAKGLMELVKALFKFSIVIGVTVLLFNQFIGTLLDLGDSSLVVAVQQATKLLLWSFLAFAASLVLIVAFDVPFELWNFNKQLRMTRQEVKDELKESEGRPEIKSRVKSLQREVSRRRMMEAVPEADVVITNPTHYAVALKYDDSPGKAPVVLAKGKDLLALRIRSLASDHDVMIFSAPPLARALYGATEIGDEIPHDLYLAVARVLAYVYQLRTATSYDRVEPPEDLPIPEAYDSTIAGQGVTDDG